MSITIKAVVDAPIETVWKNWTSSEDIIHWNNASDNWHTPKAENDLHEGGKFNYRMESRDRKNGFNFKGVYKRIIPFEKIEYTLEDNRNVIISFSTRNDKTEITETFETENTLPEDKQREGWQAILNNFKKYVEQKNTRKPVTPCLWYDNQAEEAAKFYTSIFKDSEIGNIVHYGKEGYEVHKQKEGTVQTVEFKINGQWYTALNGGPIFKFSEAISLQVYCNSQSEIDYYWEKFTKEGEEGPCGWLKDKFGLSWQIVPSILPELMQDPVRAERVTKVYLKMKKFIIKDLVEA